MSTNDIGAIQPGWAVRASDGEEIGKVHEVGSTAFEVEHGLLDKQTIFVPLARLEHVGDKEIALDVSAEEVRTADWSQPPAEGPQRHGAPLNAPDRNAADPAYDAAYDETDPRR